MMANSRWRDGIDKYIDDSIEDPNLREMAWNITIYTALSQWDQVMYHKWRRAIYMVKE